MSFISYAQNFEDVMLWRALKSVEKGFYIDVGANDPIIDSVTKAFYDRGWSGINIEPLPFHHADLERERPRDINLQCAAGASAGEVEIWECDIRGWATASSDAISRHSMDGHVGTFHKVEVEPLEKICAEHVPGDIHFLKIDVEGFEKNVIEGMNFSLFRPWILVVEATKPNSTEEVHLAWEEVVLSGGYVLAYKDGLNRFYVAKEHQHLLKYFQYPPNVFDHFKIFNQHESELISLQAEAKAQQAEAKAQQAEAKAQKAEVKILNTEDQLYKLEARAHRAESSAHNAKAQEIRAEARAQQAEARAQQAEARAQQAEARAQQAEARAHQAAIAVSRYTEQISVICGSTSWRMTAPLRWTMSQLRLLRQNGIRARLRALINKFFRWLWSFIIRRPLLKTFFKNVCNFLGVTEIFKSLVFGEHYYRSPARGRNASLTRVELDQMSPHACQIYAELKMAIAKQQKDSG